jgi:hypothetical protein
MRPMNPGRFARLALVAIAPLAAVMPAAQAAPNALPRIEGPDIPAVTKYIPVVAFDHEVFSCTEALRHSVVTVPAGYDRVVLEFTYQARTDPWDRLFSVSIDGAEVLRGTTPRTEFTVNKDVTEFGTLLPPGGTADIGLSVGTYVGEVNATVRLLFYADEPTAALVRPPASQVIAPFLLRGLDGEGQRLTAPDVAFPASAPAGADVELTLTGHGAEEFWYRANPMPRAFDVVVDGTVIATATPLPYVYALLGFGNTNANTPCAGPGNAITGDTLHPVMWWGAQRALDLAGVHLGVGEIPPYRATVDAADLALLSGARTVEVVQHGGTAHWVTSLSFLLTT